MSKVSSKEENGRMQIPIFTNTFYASLIYCVKKSRPNCYPQSASTKLLRNQGSGTDTVNSYVLNDRKINYIDLKDIS